MAAACGQPEDDDRMEQMYRGLGLLTSHAYSVLDVRTFHLDGNRDKPIRSVARQRIRRGNPHKTKLLSSCASFMHMACLEGMFRN